MIKNTKVEAGDSLIIHSPKTGYMRAWAREDKDEFLGIALFKVAINSAALPGVSEMTINLNTWDVWADDDIEVLKEIANTVLKPEYER